MKKFYIPGWLLGFAFLYMVIQIINLELPQRDTQDKPPRILSENTIEVPKIDEESVTCLAKNAYFEARNQSVLSQIAVSQVVLNRVESPDFPNTVCGVVYEAQFNKWYKENMNKQVPIKHRCQFSWYCDGMPDIIYDHKSYNVALAVANQVLTKYNINDVTNGALFYHAYYVNPKWAKEKVKTVVHEDHIFYKER